MTPAEAARRRFLFETGAIAGSLAVGTRLGVSPAQAAEVSARPNAEGGLGDAQLVVNGRSYSLVLDPRTTLLDALREHLHLFGTKKGCDRGQCGACTVLVGGRRVNSCLTLALAVTDDVTTIEGLGSASALHPVQEAFLSRDAFQCGYCTPGQICSAVALLEELRSGAASAVTSDVRTLDPPDLTDDEIRERMSGNLCRCGAYVNIVAAVRDASRWTG